MSFKCRLAGSLRNSCSKVAFPYCQCFCFMLNFIYQLKLSYIIEVKIKRHSAGEFSVNSLSSWFKRKQSKSTTFSRLIYICL